MSKKCEISKELNEKSGVYKITINNKCYIGSSKNLYKRIIKHNNDLYRNIHPNKIMQNCYNKHKTFNFDIVEFCEAKNIFTQEQYYFDTLKPEFNIRKLVESNFGCEISEEGRKNMSISKLKYFKENKVSDLTKEKMSKTRKELIENNPEIKESVSKFHKDKIISEKHKDALRLYCTGRILSDETKLKLSNTRKKNIVNYKKPKKLSIEEILEIKNLIFNLKEIKYIKIAKIFNVSYSTIRLIAKNETYKNI